jgi:hypothetical protein
MNRDATTRANGKATEPAKDSVFSPKGNEENFSDHFGRAHCLNNGFRPVAGSRLIANSHSQIVSDPELLFGGCSGVHLLSSSVVSLI